MTALETAFAVVQTATRAWWADGIGGRSFPAEAHLQHMGVRIYSEAARTRALAELHREERAFRQTGNPLCAWAAILEARVAGEPIPDSVQRYLVHAAAALLGFFRDPVERRGRPEWVARALGLHPAGTGRQSDAFDRRGEPFPGLTLAWDYQAGRFWQGRTHQDALERVALKHGVSEGTVRQAWTKWRDRL